jgi:hypothetical protein
MKKLIILFFFMYSLSSFGQEVIELGVKFSLKDTLLNIKLLDGKYKQIKVEERQSNSIVDIELIRNYYFEGDVVHDHKLFTKDGIILIEILSGDKKKKFQLLRNKPNK